MTESLRAVRSALAVAALVAAGGCAFVPPEPPAADVVAVEPPAPVTPPVAPVASLPPAPARPRAVPRLGRQIAVLYDGGRPEQAAVAAATGELLVADGHRVSVVDLRTPEAIVPLVGNDSLLAVAIGLEAATLAARALAGPLVFCQVFNHHALFTADRPIWGVEALPPIGLQLKAWKALDPSLARVALIVGEPHAALADAAVAAGRNLGVVVTYEIASSDRETSYLFKRAAPQVDGVWLPPDGRILSPGVLRELLDYAASHGVGVGVANDALLDWGALFSASGTALDVARTVHGLVTRVANGNVRDVPPLTPLAELELDVNARVAAALGLVAPVGQPWVLREPD